MHKIRLPWQRPLDYCKTYDSFIIRIYTSVNAETYVNTGSVVVEIFRDIRQFRSSQSTISIFYPGLTQKLLNRFSPFFTRCRPISAAINAFIRKTIAHNDSECQSDENGEFAPFFCTKSVAMATSLEISKKTGPDRSSTTKKLSFDVKIAKIGPVDLQIRNYGR